MNFEISERGGLKAYNQCWFSSSSWTNKGYQRRKLLLMIGKPRQRNQLLINFVVDKLRICFFLGRKAKPECIRIVFVELGLCLTVYICIQSRVNKIIDLHWYLSMRISNFGPARCVTPFFHPVIQAVKFSACWTIYHLGQFLLLTISEGARVTFRFIAWYPTRRKLSAV